MALFSPTEDPATSGHDSDIPLAPVVFDDSDLAFMRGPLGEIRVSWRTPEEGRLQLDREKTHRIVVRKDGTAYSYMVQDILIRTAELANVLWQDLRLQEGDRVLIADCRLGRQTEWRMAVQALGATPITVDADTPLSMLRSPDLQNIKCVLVADDDQLREVTKLILSGPLRDSDEENLMGGDYADLLFPRPSPSRPKIMKVRSSWKQDHIFPRDFQDKVTRSAAWVEMPQPHGHDVLWGRAQEEVLDVVGSMMETQAFSLQQSAMEARAGRSTRWLSPEEEGADGGPGPGAAG